MHNALSALTAELRRLKTAGVRTVAVSDESIAALKSVLLVRRAGKQKAPSAGAVAGMDSPGPRAAAREMILAAVQPDRATPESIPLPAVPTVTLPAGDKAARWAALREIVLSDTTCRAHIRPGKKVVFGVGSIDAKIMFVGEAPGGEEEIQGEPFVGPAGQLLTKMILGMGLKREEVYIGNIMNWRPELPAAAGASQVGNRPPTAEEMRYCLPYLRAQIEVVNPDLLVALGKTAAEGLLGFGTFKALGDVRGRWHEFAGKPLMVTYHPSYILREPTNRKKRLIWEDLLKAMERAEQPISEKQRGYFLDK